MGGESVRRELRDATNKGEALRVFRVPDDGTIKIRFLSTWDAIHAHWLATRDKRGSVPCLGDRRCETKLHKTALHFEAFAACDRLIEGSVPLWAPAVFGFSEALAQDLKGQIQIGDVWTFRKIVGPDGFFVSTGEYHRTEEIDEFRPVIDFHSAVERMYGLGRLLWGQEPIKAPRQYFLPVVAQNELLAQRDKEREETAKKAEEFERCKKLRAQRLAEEAQHAEGKTSGVKYT